MTDTAGRLRALSAELRRHDIDMILPEGAIDPEEAADEIERLTREFADARAEAVALRAYNEGQDKIVTQLEANLRSRDDFLVRIDQWSAYTSSLPHGRDEQSRPKETGDEA